MTYEIKFTNNYRQPIVRTTGGDISPALEYIPDSSIQEYISDNERSDGGFLSIPLYNKVQYVNIPPNSILILTTEDSGEAAYYTNLDLDSGTVVVSPDPINGGGGSDTNNIGKMLLERKFENGKLVVPSDVVLANKCLSPDANLYHIYLESDDSIMPIYETFSGKLIIGVDWNTMDSAAAELPEDYIYLDSYIEDGNTQSYYTYIMTIQEFTSSTWHFAEEDGLLAYYEEYESGKYRTMGAAFHYLTIGEDVQDVVDSEICETFGVSYDSLGDIYVSMYQFTGVLFQTSDSIDNSLLTYVFYNMDEDTGWIKSNICSNIEYIPGKSYVRSYNSEIDPSESSGWDYKFDDGSNFTPITTKQSLYNYLSGADRLKVYTKTDIVNEDKTLYIKSSFYLNFYKTVSCVEFQEGKYFYYTGE